ncbi:MAG: serine protease [Micromonosporaceae bacterium]|nr:serine protease [Micromonosporaceae bacterium]
MLPGASAALAAPDDQPLAPQSQRAPESAQFSEEGVTTAGELRAVSSALSYPKNGREQILRHPGATYVKVHFRSLDLAAGDYITVANRAGTEVYRYASDPSRAGRSGNSDFTVDGGPGFWAMSIDGDTAVVTLHSRNRARGGAAAVIDQFWRGYDSAEIDAHNVRALSVCGTDARRDVVCYQSSHPTEHTRSKAVAKLLIGGGGSCTTWRVGNTNRMLTNKHCISSQSGVSSSEAQFAYECAICGGNNPAPGTKVSGATLHKVSTGGSGELDYTLYSVNNFSSISGFGTLYLETRAATNGERMYIPGHGDGRPKRLSIYEDTQGGAVCTVKNASQNTWNIGYSCDTSGGNSGSPVLSANHKVIALHHLGGCPNQGAKAHMIYNDIKDLIDNGSAPPPAAVYSDTFESATGWTVNPSGSDTATTGTWERGDPAATTYSGATLQLGATVSGVNDLVTGRLAGTGAGSYDVDGGVTSIRSPAISLPAGSGLTMTFSWYFAHLDNATSADFFQVKVVTGSGATTVFEKLGSATNVAGAWQTASVNLSSYAGQSIRIQIEAADAGSGSLIEAGADDMKIVKS